MEDGGQRRNYEYIVVGCGGVGSAALYWLSRRVGRNVLGLEQFELGHSHGGSQDYSRIVRLSYHDDSYTKLAIDAIKTWRKVEEESGLQLFHVTGVVELVKKKEKGDFLDKLACSMRSNNIRFDRWSGSELHSRFPQFETDDSYEAIFQPDSGVVDAALANSVHIQLAQANGANVISRCLVSKLEKTVSGIQIHTSNGIYRCRRVVVCCGAWSNQIVNTIGIDIPITVTQEQVTYFATPHIKQFTKERHPVWSFISSPQFYGLPIHGICGTKIGIDAAGPIVTPQTRTYDPDPRREELCKSFLKRVLPKSLGPKILTKTCLYAMTPDRHFIIDTCANYGQPDVIICFGAGHIFKFASVVGKILSQLAIDSQCNYDISSFNINRRSLTDPEWTPEDFNNTGGITRQAKNKHENTQSKL